MKKSDKKLRKYLQSKIASGKIKLSKLYDCIEDLVLGGGNNRSKVSAHVGWYAFQGGNFAPHPNAYPDLLGVVAWVNPNKKAPKGHRGLIVLPNGTYAEWASVNGDVEVLDNSNGWLNTSLIASYAKKHKCNSLVDTCLTGNKQKLTKDGVFIPSLRQLEVIVSNADVINRSLEAIGGLKLSDWIWSSTEYDVSKAWAAFTVGGYIDGHSKQEKNMVLCVLAF